MYQFNLVRAAKGKGGDRFHNSDYDWTIYVPQEISRKPDGQVKTTITMAVQTEEA